MDLACQAQWPFAAGLGSILSLDPENERQAEKVGERERGSARAFIATFFSCCPFLLMDGRRGRGGGVLRLFLRSVIKSTKEIDFFLDFGGL